MDIKKLYKAQIAKDYHQLSTAIKLVMLAGILSMVFFKIYSWSFLYYHYAKNNFSLPVAPPQTITGMGREVPFEIIVKETDESYPADLPVEAVAVHIAKNKP